jgi:uncharacterized membrane protein YfhO
MLDYLARSDFDPKQTVLLKKNDFEIDFPQPAFAEPNVKSWTNIISYRPDQIVISAASSKPGYLFLSEIFYPGWKAFVDDQPTRILLGNYMFRVIELPEGKHVIRLIFDPLSIKVGIGITIFTLLTLLIIIVYNFRMRLLCR